MMLIREVGWLCELRLFCLLCVGGEVKAGAATKQCEIPVSKEFPSLIPRLVT